MKNVGRKGIKIKPCYFGKTKSFTSLLSISISKSQKKPSQNRLLTGIEKIIPPSSPVSLLMSFLSTAILLKKFTAALINFERKKYKPL